MKGVPLVVILAQFASLVASTSSSLVQEPSNLSALQTAPLPQTTTQAVVQTPTGAFQPQTGTPQPQVTPTELLQRSPAMANVTPSPQPQDNVPVQTTEQPLTTASPIQFNSIPQSTATTPFTQPETVSQPLQSQLQSLSQIVSQTQPQSLLQTQTQPLMLTSTPIEATAIAQPMTSAASQIETPTPEPLASTNPAPHATQTGPAQIYPQVQKCSADIVKGFKITSPVNFAGNVQEWVRGSYQFSDSDHTTIWLPPQEQGQATPLSPTLPPSQPLSVAYTNGTKVSANYLKPAFLTISWMMPVMDVFQEPQTATIPFGSLSQSQEQGQSQMMNQPQQLPPQLISTPQGYCLPLSAFGQSRTEKMQQQQARKQTSSSAGQPTSVMSHPERIFNPVSVKLVNAQGQTTNGTIQLAWYQAQEKNRGALLVYMREEILDGVYFFLVTGQFQKLMPVPGLESTPFSTMFYQPGPECSFLTNPFRLVGTPEMPPAQPQAQPQMQPVMQPQTQTPQITRPMVQMTPQVQPTAPQQQQFQSQTQNQSQSQNNEE